MTIKITLDQFLFIHNESGAKYKLVSITSNGYLRLSMIGPIPKDKQNILEPDLYTMIYDTNKRGSFRIEQQREDKMEIMNIEQAKSKYTESLCKIKNDAINEIGNNVNSTIENGHCRYSLRNLFNSPYYRFLNEIEKKFRDLGYIVEVINDELIIRGWD